MAKKISDYVPVLKAEGIDYLMAANASGMSIQSGVIAALNAGGTIQLEHEMADANYMVITSNSSGLRPVTHAAKTTTQFNYGGQANADDELWWAVIGRRKNQKA
jgi:hypothetical protein